MKKNIIICSTSFFEYDRRLQRISSALISRGFSVLWISRSDLNKESDNTNLILKTYFQKGILFYLEFNFRLFAKLLSFDACLVNAVDLDTLLAAKLSSLLKKHTLVFDAHEIFYEVPELEGRTIKKQVWKNLAKWILPSISHNYTVNRSLKKHYEHRYGTAYEVIRNIGPPPLNIHSQAVKTNHKKLVYLGVLNKGRGIEILIAFAQKNPEYEVILIGGGDLYEELNSANAHTRNITFKGYVKPNEIFALLQECSIGINILEANSLNYKLSLANKFFDYLHAELPSINMAYPEYEDIMSRHKVGILIKEYNLPSLTRAIKSLENAEAYKDLVAACRQHKSEYTWENESKKLIQFYQKIEK